MVSLIFIILTKISLGVLLGYTLGRKRLELNVKHHGPDSNDIKKWIYYCKETKKFYKFTPVPYICPPMSTK